MKDIYCLILGGYVNSFCIIRELHELEVKNLFVLDYGNSLVKYSNRISGYNKIERNSSSLLEAIIELKEKCSLIVVYPTDDSHIRFLNDIYDEIKDYCYIPFNQENISSSLDKFVQYEFCKKIGVPFPRTISLEKESDILSLLELTFPILVKPNKKDIRFKIFRTLTLRNLDDVKKNQEVLLSYINNGCDFIASELIPGDDTNIYAYTAFRNKKGEIKNEWTGKKLTQYPDNFGVFSSACNESNSVVREQGRLLLSEMNLFGISEPEFKYDYRDKKFKLTEINLRSMMWHRIGCLSGINLHYAMYNDATGNESSDYVRKNDNRIHLVYLKHEILNLIRRKGYWASFKHNLFGANRGFALLDTGDIKPFLYDLPSLFKNVILTVLNRIF